MFPRDASERASGWRWPLVPVTRELIDDYPVRLNAYFAAYRRVYYDFDYDYFVYAWWPIAPVAKLLYWWRRGTRWRYSAERWLNHRVIDVPEGNYLSNWHLRPLQAWTRHRTLYVR